MPHVVRTEWLNRTHSEDLVFGDWLRQASLKLSTMLLYVFFGMMLIIELLPIPMVVALPTEIVVIIKGERTPRAHHNKSRPSWWTDT